MDISPGTLDHDNGIRSFDMAHTCCHYHSNYRGHRVRTSGAANIWHVQINSCLTFHGMVV